MSVDQKTGGEKNTEVDRKMQVDGRTQGDQTEASQWTQADRMTQVDVVMQGSRRSESDRNSQEDVMAQGRVGTQAEERTQEDGWVQQDKGTQSEGSTPSTTKGHSEKASMTSLSPHSRAPKRPPSEDPRSPQVIEGFGQSQDEFSVPDKPGCVLTSDKTPGPASGNQEEAVLGPLVGGLAPRAQLPPEVRSEPVGGERSGGLEWSTPGRDKPREGLFQGPREEELGRVPPAALGGRPPGGLGPEGRPLPSPPEAGLTRHSQEGLPSTPASQPRSAAAFPPSEDKTLLSSAPSLHLGPGTASPSHPPETVAANSEGPCAKVPDADGRTSGPRTCDPGLIDSLKNYLLLLLKLSSSEASGGGPESQGEAAAGLPAPLPTLAPTIEVAGLSPRTSRRILERVENNHLVQSAQTLLLSPGTSRRLTGLLDREVEAGRQALAAARRPGPSPLSVPAIVVGEAEGPGLASGGSSEGEGQLPLEGPGLLEVSRESSMGGLLREEGGGQAAPGQGLLSTESRAQEPSPEEEAPGRRSPRRRPRSWLLGPGGRDFSQR